MGKKTMYALTFCYEGNPNNDQYPYASTIAISADKDKLIAEMNKCVEEDCKVNEEDEWDDEYNFKKYQELKCDQFAYVILQHKAYEDLFTKYRISPVNVL